MTNVCILRPKDSAEDANLGQLEKSPEFRVSTQYIPTEAFHKARLDLRLPVADFYMNCTPAEVSKVLCSSGIFSEGKNLVQGFASHSLDQGRLTEDLLDRIRKDTRISGSLWIGGPETVRLQARDQERNRFFTALVFTSAGSSSTLVVAKHEPASGSDGGDGDGSSVQLAVVQDPKAASTVKGVIRSILARDEFAELSGCLRVEVSMDMATGTIGDISMDLEPRIFSNGGTQDYWLVTQVPGGHEALLSLLITHHQQKAKGLTAKQAVVSTAFAVISSQLAATFDCIAHVAVMRSLAFHCNWDRSVLDVGCGQGVFGGLLASYHPDVLLYGTDMSEAMIEAPQIKQLYQSPIHVGPMEQTLISSPTVDHITCFSVFQYVPPMTFLAAVSQMFLKARKSITFDVPEVSAEYVRKLKNVPELSRPIDNLAALERIGIPAGWEMVMHRHCLSYTEPNYDHDVYSRYIRFERVE
ncbi:hypothetical protein F4780DRAFT_775062 [Xylariomycetidae sp. FL0641]|nr:hypothetical protein F4780DRAFT_775062 [Xylariomycetidae sp. FL0641]